VASLLLAMALRLGAAVGPLPVAAQTFTEITLPTPASRPSAITVGPDNALWFTEFGKIGRITTQGSITEFAIKAGHRTHLLVCLFVLCAGSHRLSTNSVMQEGVVFGEMGLSTTLTQGAVGDERTR
jgi:hypothetical protein